MDFIFWRKQNVGHPHELKDIHLWIIWYMEGICCQKVNGKEILAMDTHQLVSLKAVSRRIMNQI